MKTKILINIQGGNIQYVLASDDKVEVHVLDEDNLESGVSGDILDRSTEYPVDILPVEEINLTIEETLKKYI